MLPLSICLTTFNRAESLAATLDSLLCQSFGDFEIIISDDCSTDQTPEVAAIYQVRDRRVRYRRNSRNLGMPGNLNTAIAEAKGGYIANLHDGDVFRTDLIGKWKTALDEHREAPFVFNAYDILLPTGVHQIHRFSPERSIPGNEIARYFLSTFTSCVWGTVMARREAYQAAGPFDPRFGFISDVDMWLKLACGISVAHVTEPLMTLTPREGDRVYYGHPWQQLFWGLGIYDATLNNYRKFIPEEVERFSSGLSVLMRRRWLRALGLTLRRRRWDRLKEGLALCRDSPDPVLRVLGCASKRQHQLPLWYSSDLWSPLARNPMRRGKEVIAA